MTHHLTGFKCIEDGMIKKLLTFISIRKKSFESLSNKAKNYKSWKKKKKNLKKKKLKILMDSTFWRTTQLRNLWSLQVMEVYPNLRNNIQEVNNSHQKRYLLCQKRRTLQILKKWSKSKKSHKLLRIKANLKK